VRVRAGAEGDLDALVRIYNHYVVESHVTFDTEPVAPVERRTWLAGFAAEGPYRLLVGEESGAVVGYACSSRFRPRPAYASSVETAVYLDPTRRGQGAGRELYAALLALLSAEPALHRAYAQIALPNPASVGLHEALGFRRVGTYREVGFKFDRFWDVASYEKALGGAGAAAA